MVRISVFLLSVVAIAASSYASGLPINPDVTTDTLQSTICVPGYTKTVRPPTSYTNPIKYQEMQAAGLSDPDEYALDHHIPLVLGGAPSDPGNLRLLTKHDNSRKSRIEVKLQCLVCTGQVPLDQAQKEIWDDWQSAYSKYARTKCNRSH